MNKVIGLAVGIGAFVSVVFVGFLWTCCRVYVPAGEMAIVTAKTGRPLPPGRILAEPGEKGVQRVPLAEGRHFLNPINNDWRIVRATTIPAGSVGIVTSKTGKELAAGEILAPDEDSKGVWRRVLGPGTYRLNPEGYDIAVVSAINIPIGYAGVVTSLAGKPAPKGQFAGPGEKGVREKILQPGLYYVNPRAYQVAVVEVGMNQVSIVGKSGTVVDVLALATKAAASSATVLIQGESGTGKEVIAEGIHYASSRRRSPYIRVNCGAIPGALLESELFGHEKGAFTGAVKKKLGKFELADGGTIFLDEIGEMDKNMQVKLLRVLQQREFYRVGGEENVHVDVRIIAATNRNLEQLVKEGGFREDLYYRLNVIPLVLPPLRDRVDDIPLLVEHFIEKISKDTGRPVQGISPEAMNLLMHYRWPGNVRELENVIERVITLMDGDRIETAALPSYIKGELAESVQEPAADVKTAAEPMVGGQVRTWEEYEKDIIAHALKQAGSFNAAGKLLRLSHKTVAAKARKYQLV